MINVIVGSILFEIKGLLLSGQGGTEAAKSDRNGPWEVGMYPRRTLVRKLSMSKVVASLALAASALATLTAQAAPTLWASDSLSGPNGSVAPALYELDLTTGAVIQTISGFSGAGTFADALSFANDGKSIYVLDSSTNSTVRQIDLSGNVLNTFSVALDAEGLTVLADGSLIIGGGLSGVMARVDSSTGAIISQFAVQGQVFGLASDGTGTLFGLTIDGDIDSYDLTGNLLASLSTAVSGMTLGLAYSGKSFYISAVGSTIYEVALDGSTIRSFAGPAGFTEGLDFPTGNQVNPVPNPGSLALSALALAALAGRHRRSGMRAA